MVFHSFVEYAASRGLRPKQHKDKPFICRKCGAEMKHIAGTNVYLCENVPEGSKEPCGNRVFTKFVS